MVYGTERDGSIRGIVKANQNLEDLFERPELKEHMDKLKEQVQEHFGVDKPPSAAVAASQIDPESAAHSVTFGFNLDNTSATAMMEDVKDESIKEALQEKLVLVKRVQQMTESEKETLDGLERKARQIVADHVQLITEPKSHTALAAAIGQTYVGKMCSTFEKTLLLVYDNKTAGEAATMPHIRTPPFKADRVKKVIQAAVSIRNPQPTDEEGDKEMMIKDGDIYLMFDAGVAGNQSGILNCFQNPTDGKQMTKSTHRLNLHYSEEAVESRYSRLRDTAVLQQLETITVVTLA